MEKILEDTQFQEYLKKLLNNALVTDIKEHINLISGEMLVKNYGKRKAAILIAVLVGTVISCIGSLTFLKGKEFPKEFAEFIGETPNNNTVDLVGWFLGWTNVVVAAIFYTWTISGVFSELQPKPNQKKSHPNNVDFFRRYYDNFFSYFPSIGEWGLAIASTVPLTFLSVISEEKTEKNNLFKYGIVSSIAFITLLSNKYFLTLTHKQIKNIWNWFKHDRKLNLDEKDLLKQIKKAFLEAVVDSHEKLHQFSKEEFNKIIISLKELTETPLTLESQTIYTQSKNPLSIIFKDLYFSPKKVNKSAIVLVPIMAVFSALAWLGLIATVPYGVNQKISSSINLQYLLMIIAGIPLIEIGLSAGGSVGLQLS